MILRARWNRLVVAILTKSSVSVGTLWAQLTSRVTGSDGCSGTSGSGSTATEGNGECGRAQSFEMVISLPAALKLLDRESVTVSG